MLQTIKFRLKDYSSWEPAKYKPYAHGQVWDSDLYGHSNEVYILLGDERYKGSFYCTKNWCEIRTRHVNMIVPIKNVKFYKKSSRTEPEFDNNHISYGYECNEIIAVVKEYSSEDIKRWTKWKKKKHKSHSKHRKH